MTGLTDFKQASRLAVAYQGSATGKRYEMWREGICRSFCRLDAGPSGTFLIPFPKCTRSARAASRVDSRIGQGEDSRGQSLPLSHVVIVPTIVARVQDV
jgi:hypothetical protein